MFDFKPGDVLESRKGGANTLRHLAQELATLERNGSILIERNIPGIGIRTGHLLIFDGTLASAFHQADAARYGIEAQNRSSSRDFGCPRAHSDRCTPLQTSKKKGARCSKSME